MEAATVIIPSACIDVEPGLLAPLPASARRVLADILDHGPTALQSIQERTALPRRTVAYAIARLKEHDLVLWHQRLDDYRVRYFSVHPRLVHDGDSACADARKDGAIIRVLGDPGPPSRDLAAVR